MRKSTSSSGPDSPRLDVDDALIEATGNELMPAFYIMFFAALGALALLGMKETAKRPLLGSMPTVETNREARDLVENQEDNPHLDTSTMPIDDSRR